MAKNRALFEPASDSKESLDDLERRRHDLSLELEGHHHALRDKEDRARHSESANTGQAIKLSSEFLAGVVVGIILGLGFDQLLNTSPWGLIVFLALGFVAGVFNILRALGRVAPSPVHSEDVDRRDGRAEKRE